ncbi:hypothetical protein ACH5RR_003243 [Cinchona calisaya]|uniref:Uncharacterized protein n=1 Tax=Cinchona calisaya TaxID=153742 RepID=A0ABD3AU88_9GENT
MPQRRNPMILRRTKKSLRARNFYVIKTIKACNHKNQCQNNPQRTGLKLRQRHQQRKPGKEAPLFTANEREHGNRNMDGTHFAGNNGPSHGTALAMKEPPDNLGAPEHSDVLVFDSDEENSKQKVAIPDDNTLMGQIPYD